MKSSLILAVTSLALLPNVLAGIPSCYTSGSATLTNYWVTKEGTKDMDNDGNTVYLTGAKTVALKDGSGKTIEMVSKTTYDKCEMEGTCLLQNGVMCNLINKGKFEKIDRTKAPYGLGSHDNALKPFVSMASNDIPKGTKLYMECLKGLKLPGGKTHNGCVVVEDVSWSFSGCQLDFFCLGFQYYEQFQTPDKCKAVAQDCQVLSYVNSAVQNWALLGPGNNDNNNDGETTTKTTKTSTTKTSTKKTTTTTTKTKTTSSKTTSSKTKTAKDGSSTWKGRGKGRGRKHRGN